MTSTRAIETRYAGCTFRSRLEARWAVLFDTLDIRGEYEPQGYVVGLGDGRPYLPDFHLPDADVWVEVKGRGVDVHWGLMVDAIDYGLGLPDYGGRGLMILGPVPAGPVMHPLLRWHKGAQVEAAWFDLGAVMSTGDNPGSRYEAPGPLPRAVGDIVSGTRGGPEWSGTCGPDMVDGVDRGWTIDKATGFGHAYRAARSARFEHGASGRWGA